MKLLLFHALRFRYEPYARTLPDAPQADGVQELPEGIVVFAHCEAEDETRRAAVIGRAVKQIKWLANKYSLRCIVLHSFAHLSESKSSPEFAEGALEEMASRLQRVGYEVHITPFGYTHAWDLAVGGETLAKVFASY